MVLRVRVVDDAVDLQGVAQQLVLLVALFGVIEVEHLREGVPLVDARQVALGVRVVGDSGGARIERSRPTTLMGFPYPCPLNSTTAPLELERLEPVYYIILYIT